MKKTIVTLLIAFASTFTFAQTSMFDKFDGPEEISTIIVNQKMFQMLSKVDVKDKETQLYVNLIKKLENLKVYMTQDAKKALDMKLTAEKYLKSANLEELMRVNDNGKNVKIYVKSSGSDSQIRELFMFIEGSGKNDTIIMSLTGNFDLNEISVLTDKMNLPGGENLKKVSKEKK